MKRRTLPQHFTIMFVVLFNIAANASDPVATNADGPGLDQLTNYPRFEQFEQGSVQVDFPSLESWPDFRFLKAWLPVEVLLNGDSKPHVGSAYVQAMTRIDFEQRTVAISDLQVLDSQFPDQAASSVRDQLVARAFLGRENIVPLDVLLRLLPEDFAIPDQGVDQSGLNFVPPVILVSEKPLRLLSIDAEPVRAPLEGTNLEYVVNTNWNVFYYVPDARWYVLNDGAWQQNNYLADGGWTSTDKLPGDFGKLALDERWQHVAQALPARIPASPPVPFVISLEATELILLDGAPRLSEIGETGIRYVSNTQSDLFRYADHWYLLVSGRWFSNTGLIGQWQPVRDLPTAFAQISATHDKAHVLYSVPGTRQAKLALIEAALPHRNSVAKRSAEQLQVNWVGEPAFETIEGTSLQRGLNTPYQVIRHNNFYYLCYEGAWYFSDSPNGVWQVAPRIPEEIYRIPPSDPAYNVTYVRLDPEPSATPDEVNFNYSSGYKGSFSTSVSVVYGTGWHYPANVYWDPVSGPVYWQYGRTYGYNTVYHPAGAYYGHRVSYLGRPGAYGPYGGWGYAGTTTVTLSSPTVNFSHGEGSAWQGPLQTAPGDPALNKEKSLDAFLPRKAADGTEKFVDTSNEGGTQTAAVTASSLYAATTLSSNRFAGPDGEVYKREDQQWSQYDDGDWTTMQAITRQQPVDRQSSQKNEAQKQQGWLPAHKRTLSRSELDRQELARLEGMDQYSKYRMSKEASNQ